MSAFSLYIGLDAGGTKTALLAGTSWQDTSIHLLGPAANIQRQGLEVTAQRVVALIHEAVALVPGTRLAGICAGVAGAGSLTDQKALTTQIRHRLGTSAIPLYVTHDGEIALEGAFEGGSGVIVITGTGSVLFARTQQGEILQAGGWGYLLGDEGSGHCLGLQGLKAVARAFEGGASTQLQALLAERYSIDAPDVLKRTVYREQWPVQQMAPLVLEAAQNGDQVARQIVTEQATNLAQQARRLGSRSASIAPRLVLLGGLTRSDYYKEILSEALLSALPGWHIIAPAHSPLVGALRLAASPKAT